MVFYLYFFFFRKLSFYFKIELSNEQSNKRAASPNDKSQSLEYLIRGELVRACPTLSKTDGKIKFKKKYIHLFFRIEYFRSSSNISKSSFI